VISRFGRGAWRRVGLVVIGLVISVVATALVIRGVDLDRTLEIVRASDLRLLGLALFLLAAETAVRVVRWQMLLPRAASGRVPAIRILPAVLLGYLGNAVLPARLGEGVRAIVLSRREGLPFTATFGSAVLERILDSVTLAALGIGALIATGVAGDIGNLALAGLGISALALVALVIAPRILHHRLWPLPRVRGVIDGLLRGADVAGRPRVIGRAVVLTVAVWFLDAGIYWLAAQALGIGLTPVEALVVSVAAVLSTAIPAAPGFIGTFELAAAAAARAVGVAPEAALALALVAHVMAIVPNALSGVVAGLVIGVRGRGAPSAVPSP
jgi:uncharacterized membrane protein YbhN (UPF0104 family)